MADNNNTKTIEYMNYFYSLTAWEQILLYRLARLADENGFIQNASDVCAILRSTRYNWIDVDFLEYIDTIQIFDDGCIYVFYAKNIVYAVLNTESAITRNEDNSIDIQFPIRNENVQIDNSYDYENNVNDNNADCAPDELDCVSDNNEDNMNNSDNSYEIYPVYSPITSCIQPVTNLYTQVRIGKIRLDKVRLEKRRRETHTRVRENPDGFFFMLFFNFLLDFG